MSLNTEIEFVKPVALVPFGDIEVGGFFISKVGSLFVKQSSSYALLIKSTGAGSVGGLVQFSKTLNMTLVTKLEVHIG